MNALTSPAVTSASTITFDRRFHKTLSVDTLPAFYSSNNLAARHLAARLLAFTRYFHIVPLTEVLAHVSNKLPRYPRVPAALIGWLGRDLNFRGQHIGSMLLADALTRLATAPVGINAICAEAIDDAAAMFYREHQFQAFNSRPDGFYLPLKTALAAIVSNSDSN